MAETEILYGMHPVTEALSATRRRIYGVFFTEGKQGREETALKRTVQQKRIPFAEMPLSELSRLAQNRYTQGVVARVSPYPVVAPEKLFSPAADPQSPPFLLLADGVMDPGNLGALIRTGICLGITGVVTPKDRCAPPTPAVSRASAGALEHVRLSRVTNLADTIRWLKGEGIWVYGLDPSAPASLFSMNLEGPIALVVGGEEKGIRPRVKHHCDALVRLPQSAGFNSLNVSVAGGIAMYAVYRRRTERASG